MNDMGPMRVPANQEFVLDNVRGKDARLTSLDTWQMKSIYGDWNS